MEDEDGTHLRLQLFGFNFNFEFKMLTSPANLFDFHLFEKRLDLGGCRKSPNKKAGH
jgi:hypothetical protein